MEMNDSSQDKTATCWLYDIPLHSRHPLTEEMRAQLRRDSLRSVIWGILLLTVVPPACLALILLPSFISEHITLSDMFVVGWAVVMVIATLVSFSGGIFCLQRAWWSRKDLRAGEFMRFERVLGKRLLAIPEIKAMMLAGLINVGDTHISLDVMGATKRLWLVNGHPVRDRRVVKPITTAEQPRGARVAAQWLEPIGEIDGKVVQGNRRELSAEEIAEIAKYARKQWLSPLPFAFALSLWSGVVIYAAALQGKFPLQIMFFVLLFLTILCDIELVRGIISAIRLRRDRKLGEVVIMRGEGLAQENDERPAGDDKTYEVLPNSQMVWTVDGRPNSWRTR